MAGNDITASSTTDAPIMPVDAANITPIKTTVMAKPPRTRPNNSWNDFIKFSAAPDLSNIFPMNINMGNATRIQLSMILKIRLTDKPNVKKSMPVKVSK